MSIITNIAGYKFIKLNHLAELSTLLKNLCQNLKGTILVAEEGINVSLAGSKIDINNFVEKFTRDERFKDFEFKVTYSDFIPFDKLVVKIKKEIIAFAVPGVEPEKMTGKFISPKEFKAWLDSNKDIYILDVRNQCEIAAGKFSKAEDLKIEHFRDFPDAAKKISNELKKKTIVMYCTGGIRCEKASALLIQEGFEDVYQLEGGILKYFEQCGNAHYDGKCFVFDNRTVIVKDNFTTQGN